MVLCLSWHAVIARQQPCAINTCARITGSFWAVFGVLVQLLLRQMMMLCTAFLQLFLVHCATFAAKQGANGMPVPLGMVPDK
jgi:hypothetical protein